MRVGSDLQERVCAHFADSVQAKRDTLEHSLPVIVRGIGLIASAIESGRKVLACGNGGSAADAQHFAAELTGRFERERRGLPCIALTTDTSALTAIGNDYGFDAVFAKQVQALAQQGDWLLALSTSGNSPSVVKAVEAMHSAGGHVLFLSGRDGGTIAKLLANDDCEWRVASRITARIQEVHILMLHCLCDGIDEILFPAN